MRAVSSDDGTCRVWDARTARNPCVYVPRPLDAITGKGNAPPAYLPSSSNAQRGKQILCCAYNATGTVFVTGSADTSARVWSASYKPNTDNSELPIHEMDILSGHEHDVNYVQFSGCAVASKISTSDSWKEENTLKFRNIRYSHDNIVTCSRDGSAIIWVPRSRRSHFNLSPMLLCKLCFKFPIAISGKSRPLDSCISSKSATTTPASSTSARRSKAEIATYSSGRQYDYLESRQPFCTGSYYG
ncbi:bromodomain and WD repeat-containing protein 3-like [Trifolium medium]|uniref:Bromodomain and WD repeat-containing protein 3-like n=1 Tax=Trifolium medium TaxID=97028 RepID=A0A392M6R1_9FABA|nr:bromodomain and WD repeat-containing protein 3-like [Trifolium medium]